MPKWFRETSAIALAGALFIFCIVAGWFWVHQGATTQELLANYSKTMEYVQGLISVKGWPWWTPFTNMGQSLADSLGTIATYFLIFLGSSVFGAGPEFGQGTKITALIMLFLSGMGMYAFVRKLTKDNWSAFAAGLFYALCPQIILRMAASEHIVVAFCFVYPPLIGLSLLNMVEATELRWKDSLLQALSFAAMTLTYVRTAAVFLPVILIMAAALFITRVQARQQLVVGCARAACIFIFLGLFPMLPLLREIKWDTLFSRDPFVDWQHSFSIKTALSWLDRGSHIMDGMPNYFHVDLGGFYLGLVPMLAIAVFMLSHTRKEAWLKSKEGIWVRFFIGAAMFLTWLSFGPRSVLQGAFEYLSCAQQINNWVIPVFWLTFAAQFYILFHLWPEGEIRLWGGLGVSIIYLLVPGFDLIEKIPLYTELRAPWFFWEVGGSFCFTIAAGIAIVRILKDLFHSKALRLVAILLLFGIGLLDMSAYFARFNSGEISPGTFDDFKLLENFLAEAKPSGAVSFLSGRYFYLLTPQMSGRPLMREAFHSHFMTSWMRSLVDAGYVSTDVLRAQFNVCGVTYIVLDKMDSGINQQVIDYYARLFPVAYQNDHFIAFFNPSSLAPAFVAHQYIAAVGGSDPGVPTLLSFARYNFAIIDVSSVESSDPYLVGVADPKNGVQIKLDYKNKTGDPFHIYAPQWKRDSFHIIHFEGMPQQGGWLIVTQSYHPDWKAFADGKQIPTARAFCGLLAARFPDNVNEVTFKFKPPWWYNFLLTTSFVSWCLVLPGYVTTIWLSRTKKDDDKDPEEINVPLANHKINRVLVVIPTYNEKESLPRMMEDVLAVQDNLQILVVDDSSPDGTAKIVKKHPQFKHRIHLLERSGKLGYASACRDGFLWGAKAGFDAIVEMDADHSHDTADIPKLIAKLNEGYHVAIGSRYLDGVRVHNWPIHRLFLSAFAGAYVRTLLRLPLADPTSGFKAIRREALDLMELQKMVSEGYGFNVETHYIAWRKRLKLGEVPIIFTERRDGASKMSLKIMIEAALRVLTMALFR
jgi:dolichol-phosphate mannosyltransferase